jgi:Peptidase_C39 like family
VVTTSDFVGWGTAGIKVNCMDYAKAQIAKKSKKISNYYAPNQTIQIYKESTGADSTKVKDAIGYLISALNRGIPVIVGVGDAPGSHNPHTDQTTDHFIVIVGMGSDATGKYFIFYDNASGQATQGANSNNKLYFNSATWKISGQSQTTYALGAGMYPYIVTMIRKSKS